MDLYCRKNLVERRTDAVELCRKKNSTLIHQSRITQRKFAVLPNNIMAVFVATTYSFVNKTSRDKKIGINHIPSVDDYRV